MLTKNIKFLTGSIIKKNSVNFIFDKNIISFLNDLSTSLLKDKKISHPEIITFAFWCRLSNILRFRKAYFTNKIKMGRGKALHIAPKNVPINFAYSLVIGLLSGNQNIIRVHSLKCEIAKLISKKINNLLKIKYKDLRDFITICHYDSNSDITKNLSKVCNSRIIWGGDDTVKNIRKIECSPDNIDIVFPDRYSLAIINLKNINQKKLKSLSKNFYNDSYLMNQAACSSPHVVLWINYNKKEKYINEFWESLSKISKEKQNDNYAIKYFKLERSYKNLIEFKDNIKSFKNFDNFLHVADLKNVKFQFDKLRGFGGSFYSYKAKNLNFLSKIVNDKFQTIVYFGLSEQEIKKLIIDKKLKGICRIVPVGKALEFNLDWDGKDLINSLSKVVQVE